MLTGFYLPSIVEISWDTGFEGVGRQSVLFNNGVIFIDKIDNVWCILGGRPSYSSSYKGISAINCRDVGVPINNGLTCVYVFSDTTVSRQSMDMEKFVQPIIVNILTLDGLYDWVLDSDNLDGVKLTWSEKIRIDRTIKDKSRQSLDLPYSDF